MRDSTDERRCGVSSLCEIVQAQTRKHEHRSRSDFAQSVHSGLPIVVSKGGVVANTRREAECMLKIGPPR